MSGPVMHQLISPPSSTWLKTCYARPSGKSSMRSRRKGAEWDDDFLASLVTA